jgi:hypothetical protein
MPSAFDQTLNDATICDASRRIGNRLHHEDPIDAAYRLFEHPVRRPSR